MKNVTLKTAKEVRELDFLDGEWSLERLRADYDQLRWQFQNVPKYAEALMGLDNNLVHLEGILSDLSPEETWVSSPFLVDRVYGLRSLATRLISAKRPVDAWLASLPATRGALAKCRDASSDESKLHTALVQDLNTAIDGPSIYDAKRFQGIPLRADTQALKLEKPKGVALRCLNRLLLEDAYPLELARRNTWPEGAKRAFEEAIMAGLRFMALKIAAEWPRGGRTEDKGWELMRELRSKHPNISNAAIFNMAREEFPRRYPTKKFQLDKTYVLKHFKKRVTDFPGLKRRPS